MNKILICGVTLLWATAFTTDNVDAVPGNFFYLPFTLSPEWFLEQEMKTTRKPRVKYDVCPSELTVDEEVICKPRTLHDPDGCPKTSCKFVPTFGVVMDKQSDSRFGKWRKIIKRDDGTPQRTYTTNICKYPYKICNCGYDKGACRNCKSKRTTICLQKWTTKYSYFEAEDLADHYRPGPIQFSQGEINVKSGTGLTAEEELKALEEHFNGGKDFSENDKNNASGTSTPSTHIFFPGPTAPPPFTFARLLSPAELWNLLLFKRFMFALSIHRDLPPTAPRPSKPNRKIKRTSVRLAFKVPDGCSCRTR